MADFLFPGGARHEVVGTAITDGVATLCSASATANTKGSYTELSSSTPIDADGVWLICPSDDDADFLIDLAVGAAGSETIVLPDLFMSNGNNSGGPTGPMVYFPISIPSGTRVAARCQASRANAEPEGLIVLVKGGFPTAHDGLSRVAAYGISTTDSGGTSVDPGGTANTKGSYSEIVASTTDSIRLLYMAFGNQQNTGASRGRWFFDLAIGAAGSEQVILANVPVRVGPANVKAPVVPQIIGPFIMDIPAGTRLAVRAQSTITDATDRLLDVALYGAG